MGYDNYFIYNLSFPKELADRTNELLIKWCDEHYDDLYESLPGITKIGDIAFYNIEYDKWCEDAEDDGEKRDCFFGDKGEYETDYLHNSLAGEEMKKVISYLKDNGILVTGFIYTDWDGVEHWCDFWIDGEYKGEWDVVAMAKLTMNHLKETS